MGGAILSTTIKINFQVYKSSYFIEEENLHEFSSKNIYGRALFYFLNEWFNPSNTIEIQTSGSTGKPKKYKAEKWKIESSANRTINFFRLNENQNFLLSLPIDFIAGKLMVVRAILANANLITQSISSAPLTPYFRAIDFGAVTPVQLERSIKKYGIKDLPQIKKLLVGGAQVNTQIKQLLQGFKGEVYESFGMTETFTHVALRKVYPIEEDCFEVLSGINASENNGKLVLDAPDFLSSPVVTNDLVKFNSPNSFKWLGRADFTINSGGLKVQPENLEEQLSSIMEVPFAVVGKPDKELGERIVLAIEGRYEIKSNVFKNLPSNLKPRGIIYVNEIPRTSAGKVLRKDLKELIKEVLDNPI